MPNPRRTLVRNLVLYVLLSAVGITGLGLIEQHDHIPVHWAIFVWQFVIFLVLIDLPVLVLALWIGQRLDATMERVGAETLERALPIATRLFVEHYKAQQAAGNLPGPPTDAMPPPTDAQ